MASEKWLAWSVERFISWKVREVMQVHCSSWTNSDQPQGTDRWSRKQQHSLGLTCMRSATKYPLYLRGRAYQRGASGCLVCSQNTRKGNSKRVPDPEELHLKAVRQFAGGFAGQLKVIFVKLWRMASCQRAGKRLMSSLPPKEEGR